MERLLAERRWLVPAILAVPFLVTVAILHGLTSTLPTFHGSDERVYHLPTILRFADQLPTPDLHHYVAAQTPLFHLVMAVIGKAVGFQLWRLRLAEVLISYGLALAIYVLLHRRVGLGRPVALSFTLLFTLSPYVFGTSFRLLTDNLAMLFCVLALERLERFRETARLRAFLAACAAVAAAMLTRQSLVFMVGVAALYLYPAGRRMATRETAVALGALLLSVVPVGLLFLNWHGLVPPGGDPSSCGLCRGGNRGLEFPSLELALATAGLYGAILFGPALLLERRLHADRARQARATRAAGVAAAAGLLLLVLFPTRPGEHAAGLLWKVAEALPTLLDTSLLFWVLVPAGLACLTVRVSLSDQRWPLVVFLGCFLVSTLVIRFPWQKYVDPFVLIALLLSARRQEFRRPAALLGAAALGVASLLYAVDTSAHRDLPHRAAPTAPPLMAGRRYPPST